MMYRLLSARVYGIDRNSLRTVSPAGLSTQFKLIVKNFGYGSSKQFSNKVSQSSVWVSAEMQHPDFFCSSYGLKAANISSRIRRSWLIFPCYPCYFFFALLLKFCVFCSINSSSCSIRTGTLIVSANKLWSCLNTSPDSLSHEVHFCFDFLAR